MSEPADFDGFVEARSGTLLRAVWLLRPAYDGCCSPPTPSGGVVPGEASSRPRCSRSDPHDAEAEVELREVVLRALAELPRRQRATVVLRYYCDLSEAETADTLGCSVGTVKSQAAKGLAHRMRRQRRAGVLAGVAAVVLAIGLPPAGPPAPAAASGRAATPPRWSPSASRCTCRPHQADAPGAGLACEERVVRGEGHLGRLGQLRGFSRLVYVRDGLHPTARHVAESFPSDIYVRSPGCYAVQVDGQGFTETIVFRAVG